MTTNVSDSSHSIEQVGGILRESGGHVGHIALLHLVNIKIDKFFGQTTGVGNLRFTFTMTPVFALHAFQPSDKELQAKITFAWFESFCESMSDEMSHTPGSSRRPRNLQS